MLEKIFKYKGRIRRRKYLEELIAFTIVLGVLGLAVVAIGSMIIKSAPNPLSIMVMIPFLLFYFLLMGHSIASGAKRCHDLGKSGWYQFIPFYGLFMLFQDGQVGTNQYGEDPKAHLRNKTSTNNEGLTTLVEKIKQTSSGGFNGYNGGHNAQNSKSNYQEKNTNNERANRDKGFNGNLYG